MMISPETYYEEYLKGKNEAQIISAIRGLKNTIGRLKNIMEHPAYGEGMMIHPSEDVQIWCNRLYLQRAKQALEDVGGTYIPSQAEMKAAEFEANIPKINKLVFSIGGFFSGYETRTILLDDDKLTMSMSHSAHPEIIDSLIDVECVYTKEAFLNEFRQLYIGEWRSRYDLRRFGGFVLDGTQWNLEIYFSNGHKPVKIYGDNAYPYNFEKLQELFGMKEEEWV